MIYPYRCYNCDLSFERICSLAQYVDNPTFNCPNCDQVTTRVITPPRIFTKSFEPFRSPVDGSMISTYRELAEHNKRNNVVQLHEGYDEKAVQAFTQKDWFNSDEKQRQRDLHEDMKKAVQKLEEGYTPTPAEFTEEPPDA